MKEKNEYRLYNILLPIWMMIWLPGWWWLLLIPANFAADYAVLRHFMKKKLPEYKHLLKKYAWKTWLLGFLSDFIGVLAMFGIFLACSVCGNKTLEKWSGAAMLNVWHDPFALLVALGSTALSGWMIYLFNKKMFAKNAEIGAENAKYLAKRLAVLTAPYLYLIPVYFGG